MIARHRMRFLLVSTLIGLVLLWHWSCAEPQAKQRDLVLHEDYHKIRDIISLADCDSPFGKYTTEVRSSADGSCYFHQKFAESDAPFIVKIDSSNSGFILNENDSVLNTLAREDVELIRGHEIHKMSIDPWFFFERLVYRKKAKQLNATFDLYTGLDKLKHPVKIYYQPDKKLISRIELRNPKDTSQTIEIVYDKWIQGKFGPMVKKVEIIQAKKDTFYFNFSSLKIRDETAYRDGFNTTHPNN